MSFHGGLNASEHLGMVGGDVPFFGGIDAGDADRYRDEWLPHARKHGLLLLAPEFSLASFPAIERQLAEKSGWNAATRSEFRSGHDDIGPCLDFTLPKSAAE